MTEDEFETKVFQMLYALTDNYPAGVGPSCTDVAARITVLSREIDHSNTDGRVEGV